MFVDLGVYGKSPRVSRCPELCDRRHNAVGEGLVEPKRTPLGPAVVCLCTIWVSFCMDDGLSETASIASQPVANVGHPNLELQVCSIQLGRQSGSRNRLIEQDQPWCPPTHGGCTDTQPCDTHTTDNQTDYPSCCFYSPVQQNALYTVGSTGYPLDDVQLHREGSAPAPRKDT